jgi:hypothetical protein
MSQISGHKPEDHAGLARGERPAPAAKLVKRAGRGAGAVIALGVLAATALGAYAVHGTARPNPRFAVDGAPAQQAVIAGGSTRYTISVSRRGFRGPIRLSVTGTPRFAQADLAARGGSFRTLTVATSRRTPAGRYRLTVRARGGANRSAIPLVLMVRAPKIVQIGIAGTAVGLQPGAPQPLDLVLRNRGREWLWVTSLKVTAKSVSAPRSSALLPCTLADFSTRQFSGIYPLVMRPSSTRRLSGLGVSPAQQPQVALVNRAANQDGCQGAIVRLSYSARGMTI